MYFEKRRKQAKTRKIRTKNTLSFNDIVVDKNIINDVKRMIMLPLAYPEIFDGNPQKGILFYGPPGTGKTHMARIIADECSKLRKTSLIVYNASDCASQWFGESERKLRELFKEARERSPAIIFFDEIESFAQVRFNSNNSTANSSIVSTLLTLMDGFEGRGEIMVIGATNRIELVDSALRRPGRFDKDIKFDLPNQEQRKEMFKIHTQNWKNVLPERTLKTLSHHTKDYSGADIKALCMEAKVQAFCRAYPKWFSASHKKRVASKDLTKLHVKEEDFKSVMKNFIPSSHRDGVIL